MLNLLFHSSEAIVGGSPYNRTQAELDAFCDRLERFLAFATRDLGAVPATFAEFHAAYAQRTAAYARCGSSTSRRTCHPTRPPTRCCRGSSATGRADEGADVEYVAHPPRSGGHAPLAGPVTWIPRSGGGLPRLLKLASARRGLPHLADAPAPHRARRPRARPQQRPARRARRAARAPAGQAGRPHAVRHRDLALRAEEVRAGPLHARLSRGVVRDLLQRPAAWCARRSWASGAAARGRSTRPSATASRGTTWPIRARRGPRSASRTHTCCST